MSLLNFGIKMMLGSSKEWQNSILFRILQHFEEYWNYFLIECLVEFNSKSSGPRILFDQKLDFCFNLIALVGLFRLYIFCIYIHIYLQGWGRGRKYCGIPLPSLAVAQKPITSPGWNSQVSGGLWNSLSDKTKQLGADEFLPTLMWLEVSWQLANGCTV